MSEILWLGDERCDDVGLVGAKAANLSQLAELQLVPPGYALTAVQASKGLDGTLAEDVRRAYQELGARAGQRNPRVAVRSSALDEDSGGASFAGQHDTYLNITGEAAVVDAVERCCASALSSTAMAYREQQGLQTDAAAIAVLVQQLVHSEVSAVVFSANPITLARDEIMINASWGLGESVVSGTVTPDTYVIRKSDHSLISRQISSKDVMTVMVEGGIEEVPVPADLKQQPSLNASQVIEMARLVTKMEDAMGWPADVECAFAYDELYLLQCRPITTMI
ncbi:MAG TPA: PEP/pyruvate-binding domain-containing protein [Dehalococcoidia bacterium]|nr:PEP/pyruvate-binding domain-containing protein [Dehalococcoidia bacterium]